MRIHFSSVATAFVALLFVLGTVGCKHTGGDWYNPKSYTWTTPSSKDSPASPRSGALANQKPSLNDQPNISTPLGGHSDGSRATAATRDPGVSAVDHWGQNQVTSQTPPGHLLTGYTEPAPSAIPSNYPPDYLMGGNPHGNQQGIDATQPWHLQQNQHPQQNQFAAHAPQDMWHQQSQMSHEQSNFGTMQQAGLHQQGNPSVYQHPHQAHQFPGGVHGGTGIHGNTGVHSGIDHQWGNQQASYGYGAAPQYEPFGAVHQPVTVPASGYVGYGYDPQMQMQAQQQQGFQNSGVPAAPHQQHYQPPPTSGFPSTGGVGYY